MKLFELLELAAYRAADPTRHDFADADSRSALKAFAEEMAQIAQTHAIPDLGIVPKEGYLPHTKDEEYPNG